MDGLTFLIPFVFPGVFIRMVYGRFFPSVQEDKGQYNEIVHAFLISTVILIINSALIIILYGVNIMSLDAFKEFIAIPDNLVMFFLITFILSLLGVPVYRWIIDYAAISFINIFRTVKKIALESEYLSPWHAVFENENFSLDDRPVGIFKGNELVTIGFLGGCPAAGRTKKDFILINTWFKELYYADELKDRKDKLFDLIDKEYYDSENDMLIKFYNNEYLMKYLRENNLIVC